MFFSSSFFNLELIRATVVFAPGARDIVLRNVQNLNSADMVVPVSMPECVGCFSTSIDLVEGDRKNAFSFGRPNDNIAEKTQRNE